MDRLKKQLEAKNMYPKFVKLKAILYVFYVEKNIIKEKVKVPFIHLQENNTFFCH